MNSFATRLFFLFCLSVFPLVAETGVRYYSNSIGSQLSPVPEYKIIEFDQWWIEIFHNGTGILRKTLSLGGIKKKEWVYSEYREGVEEQYFQDGVLRKITRNGKNEELLGEIYYDNNGNFIEEKRYLFEFGVVSAIETYDDEGELINLDSISLRKDGSLRTIERAKEESERSWGWERGSNEILTSEWKKEGDVFVLNEYDGSGKLLKLSEFEDEKLIREKKYFYSFNKLIRSEDNDIDNDIVEISYFENGLCMKTETLTEGVRTALLVNIYDTEKRLLKSLSTRPYVNEVWQYEYSDERHTEIYFYNGIKVSEKIYEEGTLVRKNLFRDNELFTILRYNGGNLEQEEFWNKGKLIRTIDHTEDDTPQ